MTTLEDQLRAQSDAVMVEAEAREKRRKIVRSVAHSSAMEGMPLDPEMMGLFERYVDGSMTMKQIRETLLKPYRP